MPKAPPKKMASELIKLEQDALIELWEIDLTHIYSSSNPNQRGEIFRFHNGVSQTQQNIWWQGNEYQAYPIAADGLRFRVKDRQIVQHSLSLTCTVLSRY